ncbi:MAG TPA: hypothetical protein VML58_07035 [Burkholderiaceae bacterium]|nr:hypothetical protein [Burkholderiaceae bacterium]
MKSFKTLVLAKSIAALMVAAAGIAAPVVSHASPDDGMTCRAGYSGQAVNGAFKCSRVVTRVITLDCPVDFPTKVFRARVGASDGRDVCVKANSHLNIPFDAALTGLVEGQDYKFPLFQESRLAATAKATQIVEERNLSLADDQVDVRSTHGVTTGALTIDAATGAEDGVQATITLFTFAIPAANLTLVPINPPRLP